MASFSSYPFRKAYKKIHKLGDRLAKIEPLTDWEAFRPIIQPLYDNKTPKGGRPNIDEVMPPQISRGARKPGSGGAEMARGLRR